MNSLKTIGWGLYLASSWTWCIGMFLPVVLLHRYGWQGFLMFVIPNIIGCAAFGYVIKTPEKSKSLVEKYGKAMVLFSIATVAFHVFFISMILQMHSLDTYNPPFALIAIVIAGTIAIFPKYGWIIFGSSCWIVSLGIGLTFLPFDIQIEATKPWQDVYWLLPITTFGFLLCPYLDPTFHRALQESPSKHSFGIFGIAFAMMIGVTCLYQNVILTALPLVLLIHLGIQSIFTISTHIAEGDRICGKRKRGVYAALMLIAVSIAFFIARTNKGDVALHIEDYLRFFVFYGLIFPGIVAAFMLTGKSFTWIRIALFTLVALISLPLLESAYIGDESWLAIFPVIVFLTWAFADSGKKEQCIT